VIAAALTACFAAACGGPDTTPFPTADAPSGSTAVPTSVPDTEQTPTATPTPTIAPLDPQPRLRGFVPLDDPSFITAEADTFIGDDELVLGYDQDGEARAYPVSMMRWHHIINDTVQDQPLLVTY
jgi:hypothetical protein